MKNINFFTAIVNHKHGINWYASLTEEGLEKELADYCRESWDDWGDDILPTIPKKDDEVISAYFEGLAESVVLNSEWTDQASFDFELPQEEKPEPTMETYTVLALSTGHITKEDNNLLHSITHRHPYTLDHPLRNMIMERDEGYFIKLYDHDPGLNQYPGISEALQKIMDFAYRQGHRLIELNCDAPDYPELFETFDW